MRKFVWLSFLLVAATATQAAAPITLKCEYLTNPIGIDVQHPRLSWQLEGTAIRPLRFRVSVGTDSTGVAKGMNQWQKDIDANQSQLVEYSGASLRPFTKYYWKVLVWSAPGKWTSSAIGSFETGMMSSGNWKGAWISDTRDINLKPAAIFRKEFLTQRKVIAARAYIACAGLYELTVNNNRVGDHRLDPMYTRFDRRTLYVTYDVTSLLQIGKNCIGVVLGNGWYNHQSTAVWFFDKAPWRGRPSFCMDLRIQYSDGSTETIATGKDWKTTTGPIIFNSIYTGEHYDARLEKTGWRLPGFADTAWKEPIFMAAPSKNIVAQTSVPIRIADTLHGTILRRTGDTNAVFAFPKNIAGIVHLQVSGKAGTIIRLKHGERLDEKGHVDQSNIDVHYRPTDNTDPFQTDIYILKGDGTEQFMPRFNYKGFQYVELSSSAPVQLSDQTLTAYFMHSDVAPAGSIHSSSELINKIWAAGNQSYLSNLYGYPTDCPQREKNGWTGDAQINIETGLYNFDGITVYEKWLADHRDEQQPNGVLPAIIPTGGWGYEWANGPDWTSTIAIIPWNLYLFYGDKRPLEENYEAIKRYVDHINETYPSGLTSWGLGDWIPVKSVSPVELSSTCYYYADALILAKAAKILGKQEDHQTYDRLAEKIKLAFNKKYYNEAAQVYGSGLQTELSMPLFWGLVPEKNRLGVAASLAKRVAADSMKLDVGLLGTKAILNALSENGYADIAFKLASRETYPSWGWWIKNGATTLYENWPADAKSDASLNHIMFGEISAWFYKALGGIKPDPTKPGFSNILLEPHFVQGLDSFEARHQTPYGELVSSWSRKNNEIQYTVSIPSNSTATLDLNGEKKQLGAGRWNFEVHTGMH
jgi:alpha-L-rhamnosidase